MGPRFSVLGGNSSKDNYPGMTAFQKQLGGKGVSGPSGIAAPVKGIAGNFVTGIK